MTIKGDGIVTGSTAPAFSAYQSSAQSLTSTLAKINLQSEEFDTANCFDTSTSRFTPTIPGYYHVCGALDASSTPNQVIVSVYKNGAEYKRGFNTATSSGHGNVSVLVYLNGTTDYVELWGSFSTTQNTNALAYLTYFQGYLARSA